MCVLLFIFRTIFQDKEHFEQWKGSLQVLRGTLNHINNFFFKGVTIKIVRFLLRSTS